MSDQAGLSPSDEHETTPYRASAGNGLEPAREVEDYRRRLRSRRWDAAPLRNPEVERSDPRIVVLAIVAMSLLTLLVLVVGYGVVELWSLPG